MVVSMVHLRVQINGAAPVINHKATLKSVGMVVVIGIKATMVNMLQVMYGLAAQTAAGT